MSNWNHRPKISPLASHTTGSDPYLVGRWQPTRDKPEQVLEFEYFCTAGIKEFSAYVGPPINERRHASLPDIPIAQGWQRYTADLLTAFDGELPEDATLLRLDFGVQPDVRSRFATFVSGFRSAAEKRTIAEKESRRQTKIAQLNESRNILATHLRHRSSLSLLARSMSRSRDQTWKGPDEKLPLSWQLVEYPPETSIDENGVVVDAIVDHSEGFFHIALPRRVALRDRLHSAWRLRDSQGHDLTARHQASDIRPTGNDFAVAQPSPASQKGLTCFSRRGPQQDLLDLGVSAVTINLVLNRFLSRSPGPGRTPLPSADDLFFDQRVFGYYDALIDFARQNDIVVTAIVLIPSGHGATDRSVLVHPESDGDHVAMPNISNEHAAKVYAYLLDKIADRYSNTAQSPGGITNWIAHNEVDFHGTWTNMALNRASCTRKLFIARCE